MRYMKIAAVLAALFIGACTSPEQVSAPQTGDTPTETHGILRAVEKNDWIIIDPQGRRLPAEEVLAKKSYETYPYKWKKSTLTYAFDGTWDTRAKNLAHMAFSGIGSVIPLEFQNTSDVAAADFTLVLQSAAEMQGLSGEAESTLRGPDMNNLEYSKVRIRLAYSGHRMASRDNEFLNTAMHEIAHGVGMRHSQHSNAMMYHTYYVVNGVPKLYFPSTDDIQGLQSIYGTVPPKYPTWNHRYTIATKVYVSSSPYPGAPPIGWVFTGDSYPLWSSVLNRSNEINAETFRINILR